MALPLLLQTLLGYTAMQSGLALARGPGDHGDDPIVGFLLSKFEARWLMMIGLVVSAIGLLEMSRFDLDVDFRSAVLARVVLESGPGLPIRARQYGCVYFIAKQRTSYATGLINLARNMGGSTGIALATALIARREQFHQQRLIDHVSAFDGAYRSTFQEFQRMFMAKGADAAYAASPARQMIYNMVQRQPPCWLFWRFSGCSLSLFSRCSRCCSC
jgi:DHA2 family multidrug resistance protein